MDLNNLKAKEVFGGLLFGIVVVVAIAKLSSGSMDLSSLEFSSHDGPKRLVSIGLTRFESCDYKGSFAGGAGYDCIVRNHADEERDEGKMGCAGFDADDRMVRSESEVLDLYNVVMNTGEERVVRVYAPETSETLVCAENGDLVSPASLQRILPELQKNQIVSDFHI